MRIDGMPFLKNLRWSIIIIFLTLLLPSCGVKYYEVAKTEFPQGKEKPVDRDTLSFDLQSKKVYDQFATVAMFDFLYLSDKVREIYVDLYCRQRGKDEGFKSAMLRRQFEENKHWISFYVLSSIRDEMHRSLTDKESVWSLFLSFPDNQKASPVSVEEVDLSPEIRYFFGYRLTRYKRAYLVKFPSKDVNGNFYLKDVQDFKLVASTVDREVEFSWGKGRQEAEFTNKRKPKRWKVHEDIYWL